MEFPSASQKASSNSKARCLLIDPIKSDHASPIDIPNKTNEGTLIPAVLEKTLKLPSSVDGSGGGAYILDISNVIGFVSFYKNGMEERKEENAIS